MTLFEAKSNAIKVLGNAKITSTPSLDVEVILCHILNCTKTQLLLNSKEEISEDKVELLKCFLEKRKTGLPLAYIIEKKEFFGYNFFVTPQVLIPKPDTEILTELAISISLEKILAKKNSILTICDMCTGSGCIGLSILKNLLEEKNIEEGLLPKIILADISKEALLISEKNARSLFSEKSSLVKSKISFCQTNLFENLKETFDIIVSNPPYIPSHITEELLKDGRSEPRLALDGDVNLNGEKSQSNDGLEVIRNLIPQAKKRLSPGGIILMETGEYNAKKAAKIAENLGFKSKIHKDLEGQLRVVELR